MKNKPKAYPHPKNPRLIFWDTPGVGGMLYPTMKDYTKCKDIDIEKYDAFLIFSKDRFRNIDLLLAKKAKSMDKPFFFIHAHVSVDISNAKRDEGFDEEESDDKKSDDKKSDDKKFDEKEFDEKETLQTIRGDLYTNLKEILKSKDDIYLIDNYKKKKWDFDRLIKAISDVMSPRVKEAFILSLTNVTRGCLKRKATQLKGKLFFENCL